MAQSPAFRVDPSYLARHDIVYQSPPMEGWEGLPIGNGDLGAMLWCTKTGITLQVNKSDAWDQPHGDVAMSLRSCGRVTIDFGAPCFEWIYLDDFEARLSLRDATCRVSTTTPFLRATVESLAQVNRNVIALRCRVEAPGGKATDAAPVRIGVERYGSRGFTSWYAGIPGGAARDLGEATSGARKGDATLRVRLNGTEIGIACRVVGSPAKASRAGSRRAELTVPAAASREFTLLISVVTSNESKAPLAAATALLDAAQRDGDSSALAEHERWWSEFWKRSFVHIGDDYIENLYYLHMYLMASSSRAQYPALFNGSLWIWNHDVRNWTLPHHWNMQQAYWSMCAANHLDLLRPYLDTYWRLMPKAEAYAASRGYKNAILWNEKHDMAGRMIDWQSSSFNRDFTPASQIAMRFWEYARSTGDDAFLRERAYPFMKRAAEFYLQYLQWDAAKRELYVYPASPYESEVGMDFRNTASDLSMVRALFPVCIEAATALGIDEGKRAQWTQTLERLAPYSYIDIPGTGEALALAQDKDGKPVQIGGHDYAFCNTLSPVFPSGVVGLRDRGTRLFDAEVRRVKLHPRHMLAIAPVAVVAARLGMADEAKARLEMTVRQLQHFPQGLFYNIDHWYYLSRYAGKVPDTEVACQRDYITDTAAKYPNIPVRGTDRHVDTPTQPFVQCGLEPHAILAEAVNEMLLQSYDGDIRVFPATPSDWPAAFTLRAIGGFLVTSEKDKGGVAKYVQIESTLGRECRLVNPWPDTNVTVERIGGVAPIVRREGDLLFFATERNALYMIRPADAKPSTPATFTGAPNPAPKRFQEAILGKARDY
jgi:alpha-L-fucosidase 2